MGAKEVETLSMKKRALARRAASVVGGRMGVRCACVMLRSAMNSRRTRDSVSLAEEGEGREGSDLGPP